MKNLIRKKLNILPKTSLLFLIILGIFLSPISFNNKLNYISISLVTASEDAKARQCRLDCYTKYMPTGGPFDNAGYKTCSTKCKTSFESREEIGGVETALKGFVHYVFVIPMAWFASLGANMAGILLDPTILNNIFSNAATNTALYEMWTFVRDLLNLLFIFVLLFSAFATIFQIQKYHLLKSNALLMIIIMAILVNFSWPITRVIIDAGNVTMFYLLDNLVTAPSNAPRGEYFFGLLTDGTGMIKMIALDGDDQQDAYDSARVTDQIAAGIFLMLFAITFLAIAAIFIIRIVIFIILLIFSPIGFVAAIFPGTAKFSSMWWDALLKWTFIGPLMVFMVYISTTFIIQMSHLTRTVNGFGVSSNQLIINGVTYSAGIVMLWASILVAQEMGGSAGSFVASKARNARGQSYRMWKRGVAGVAGGTYIASRAGARWIDNKSGNNGAKFIGNVSGRLQSYKRKLYDDPKNEYTRQRTLSEERAQGSDRAANADKAAQEKYKKELDTKDIDTILKKAALTNKNENERKAARALLTKNDKIKSEQELASALEILSDSTHDTNSLLKSAPKHLFKEGNTNTYKKLVDKINSSVPSGTSTAAVTARKKADKQIKQVNKQFTETGRADIIYEHQISEGVNPTIAVENATRGLNAEKIAKQTKLLEQANSGTTSGNAINAHIKAEFVENPILRQELLKNLSSSGISSLKTTILAQERREDNLTKVNDEINSISRQINTMHYANRSSWTATDTERELKLTKRRASLQKRKAILEK